MGEKTVREKWLNFKSIVLDPIKPGDVQLIETKRAFYAGSLAMFKLIASIDCESEKEDMKALKKLHDEITDFYNKGAK